MPRVRIGPVQHRSMRGHPRRVRVGRGREARFGGRRRRVRGVRARRELRRRMRAHGDGSKVCVDYDTVSDAPYFENQNTEEEAQAAFAEAGFPDCEGWIASPTSAAFQNTEGFTADWCYYTTGSGTAEATKVDCSAGQTDGINPRRLLCYCQDPPGEFGATIYEDVSPPSPPSPRPSPPPKPPTRAGLHGWAPPGQDCEIFCTNAGFHCDQDLARATMHLYDSQEDFDSKIKAVPNPDFTVTCDGGYFDNPYDWAPYFRTDNDRCIYSRTNAAGNYGYRCTSQGSFSPVPAHIQRWCICFGQEGVSDYSPRSPPAPPPSLPSPPSPPPFPPPLPPDPPSPPNRAGLHGWAEPGEDCQSFCDRTGYVCDLQLARDSMHAYDSEEDFVANMQPALSEKYGDVCSGGHVGNQYSSS